MHFTMRCASLLLFVASCSMAFRVKPKKRSAKVAQQHGDTKVNTEVDQAGERNADDDLLDVYRQTEEAQHHANDIDLLALEQAQQQVHGRFNTGAQTDQAQRQSDGLFNANSISTEDQAESGCGSCSGLSDYMWSEAWSFTSDIGATDTAVGHSGGQCCRFRHRLTRGPHLLMSASKMVTGYTMLKLVDEGVLTLDTKAADVFDYWTATDHRKDVTLRHLLSLTAGLTRYPLGLGLCTDGILGSTRACAKDAYENRFQSGAAPGTEYEYTETTFFVASAMALEATGLSNWDDVFQQYMARPLGINASKCEFSFPFKHMALAGGGMQCDTGEYAKILKAILGKTLYKNTSLYDEAERPHTVNVKRSAPTRESVGCSPESLEQGCSEAMMPEWASGKGSSLTTSPATWHYGLGQFIECPHSDPNCENGILRASSPGALGAYPWVDRGGRSGHAPHWGMVTRNWPTTGPGLSQIQREVTPQAAAIVR